MNIIEYLSEMISPGTIARNTGNNFALLLSKKNHTKLQYYRNHKDVSVKNGRFYFHGIPVIRVKPFRDLSTRKNKKRLAILKPKHKAHPEILENLALRRMK